MLSIHVYTCLKEHQFEFPEDFCLEVLHVTDDGEKWKITFRIQLGFEPRICWFLTKTHFPLSYLAVMVAECRIYSYPKELVLIPTSLHVMVGPLSGQMWLTSYCHCVQLVRNNVLSKVLSRCTCMCAVSKVLSKWPPFWKGPSVNHHHFNNYLHVHVHVSVIAKEIYMYLSFQILRNQWYPGKMMCTLHCTDDCGTNI